jgi:dihydrolipoamide dehydrogenase
MKLVIIGAGPGGYIAAIRAAQSGLHVTVIEDKEVGGACLNSGCIPTKSIIASTELLSKSRHLDAFGLEIAAEIKPNLSRIIERKNRIVSTQIKGIRNLFRSWGIILKEGRGKLTSPRDVTVTTREGLHEKIEADKIIIATGSRPYQLPAFPFNGESIISSDDALSLREIPKTLLIIGAGVIGCEFACIFRELGSEVTVLEMLPHAVSTEDTEISELLERELKKKKIRLFTNVKTDKVEIRPDGVHVLLNDCREIIAEKVLVSVGRAFNSEGIGIEDIGVMKGERGEIIVNDKLETTVSGVYAIGDVIGGLLLAHVASREGTAAVANVLGGNEHIDYNSVPSAIFTSPEIASVGLREHQAYEKGVPFRTGHFQFRSLGKAHTVGEIEGFIKVISDAETDRLLGVHIIGPHASELIHEAALAVRMKLKTKDIEETIHAHPTLAEVLMEAAADAHGRAIHMMKQ